MIAASLTIGIGGSGGVFAPSLFIGATSGTAFGEIADHLLGPGAGPPALYAAVAMAAVFASATRAPLTSLASVVEMTGDLALTLPVMLAVAIATALSRALSYGTIYTAKLLRRGTDIRPRAAVAGPGRPHGQRRHAPVRCPARRHRRRREGRQCAAGERRAAWLRCGPPSPVTCRREPEALVASESLVQTLRQLWPTTSTACLCSPRTAPRQGWLTDASIIAAVACRIHGSHNDVLQAARAADRARPDPGSCTPGARTVRQVPGAFSRTCYFCLAWRLLIALAAVCGRARR